MLDTVPKPRIALYIKEGVSAGYLDIRSAMIGLDSSEWVISDIYFCQRSCLEEGAFPARGLAHDSDYHSDRKLSGRLYRFLKE